MTQRNKKKAKPAAVSGHDEDYGKCVLINFLQLLSRLLIHVSFKESWHVSRVVAQRKRRCIYFPFFYEDGRRSNKGSSIRCIEMCIDLLLLIERVNTASNIFISI